MNNAAIIQAARGPVMLITVGALMVIDYNTPYGFSRTWPVLFIVFGILKLLERMAGPPQPAYPATVPPGFAPAPQYQAPEYQAPPGTYTGSQYQTPPNPPQGPGGIPQ